MYQRAMSDRPAYPVSEKNSGLPSFQSDWCVCMPEPLSWKMGFGMNVSVLPAAWAVRLRMYLNVISWSPIASSVLNFVPISP